MTFIRILLFSIFMVATACTAGGADNAWYGEYRYSASGGETVSGSQILMNITVKIEKPGNEERCRLDADGYQTYDRILCTTATNKNQLMLQFKSYENGKIVNEIGVERYKVGETLFSLEKESAKNEKKQSRYIPHWLAYVPFGRERKNAKDYFEKIK